MTQEEKQLLLKDLCTRLQSNVIINTPHPFSPEKMKTITGDVINGVHIEQVKPYLRPMSSMTDDEREEIEVFIFNEWYQEDSCKIDKEGWIEILANYDVSGIDPGFCSDYVDWLNEHHFDYRGLIEKGLAFEAPEGMYGKK